MDSLSRNFAFSISFKAHEAIAMATTSFGNVRGSELNSSSSKLSYGKCGISFSPTHSLKNVLRSTADSAAYSEFNVVDEPSTSKLTKHENEANNSTEDVNSENVTEEDKAEEAPGDPELEPGYQMSKICDRLIEVFGIEKKEPAEWRKLLAFSSEWSIIRPYFFKRCKEVASKTDDLKKKEMLFKLARRLKEVDDDMERHNRLLKSVEEAEDINTVVTYYRKDFTTDFFEHVKLLAQTKHKDPARADELITLATNCVSAINAHDQFLSSKEMLEASQKKFSDILNSPDLQTACGKIDDLARRNQLDPHLMMMITKAWAASKETDLNKEDVQDMMYSLYLTARGNMQRELPKEIRIIKYLMTLEDPRQIFDELVAAFSPGDELQTKDVDYLYTTPDVLHRHLVTLLKIFDNNLEVSSVEITKMTSPAVINKLVMLKDIVEKEFL